MKRTNLYLDESQTAALDDVARGQGISRAELVRQLLGRALDEAPVEITADLMAIRESFGVMAVEHTVDRGPDERAAHLERLRAS